MAITEVEVPALSARLDAVADEVSSLVAGLGAEELSGPEAARLTMLFARIERLAMAGKTLAAGRVAETGWHRAVGFDTAQKWLADRTKATGWDAARTIETARHLGDDELGLTRAALVSGSLTATQANEIATASAKEPEEQGPLLAFAARETTARLRDECRQVRLARTAPEDPEGRRQRIVKEMAFGHRDLGGGVSELFARMPTSWMVLSLAAVRSQCEAVFANARATGRDDPHQAYMVEALVTLLLFGGLDDRSGGNTETEAIEPEEPAEPEAPVSPFEPDACVRDPLYGELLAAIRGPAPPGPPRRVRRARRGRCRCGGRVAPRAKILVRVDQSALLRGHAVTGELCDIAGVGPVPVETVRELWPDAVVKLVVTRGVDVLNVTSLGRRATEAMETAMQFAVPRCTNIACDNDRFVQIDHRLGWANVHRTRLGELDPLCSHCHGLKTNHNWQLVSGSGRRRFVPPEHPDHPGDPPTPLRRAS